MPTFGSISDLLSYLRDKLNRIVDIREILDENFMMRHTKSASIESFFDASGMHIRTKDDLLNVDMVFLDQYVAQNSDFERWSDMYSAAAKCWIDRQLSRQ